MENNEKHKNYRERFVRWQQITIQQFSFTNNLFLGLNLAFLSFIVTQTGFILSCICGLVIIQFLTILSLGISFFTGIYLVFNRLKDFQKTTQLVKNKEDRFEIKTNKNSKTSTKIELINLKIKKLEDETHTLGRKTWTFLNWQLWTFFTGTILGLIYLILENNLC